MPPAPIKILLHNQGEDVETPWAIPVPSPPGRTFVRLDNVPFLHAKPTYGDVIEVAAHDDQPGRLSWNAEGRSYQDILDHLEEDGGRYAVIVDYQCDDLARWKDLVTWTTGEADLAWEGLRGPRDGRPGRAYIAVRYAMLTHEVMSLLQRNTLGFHFELIHPL